MSVRRNERKSSLGSERRELSDCGFNGKFAVEYTLNNAKLSCEQNSGTIVNLRNRKQISSSHRNLGE